MALPLPQLDGKYEILLKLSEGGQGAVYKVRHRLLDEIRIIKVIRSQIRGQEEARLRFVREAQNAIKLRHPHIAQIYDFSLDDDGHGFIVMEFIDGLTLQEVLQQKGPPSIELTIDIALQSLRALEYLHKRGFVHRDIASDNIMLTTDYEGHPLIKLIDLGIAKPLKEDVSLTRTGVFVGKLPYGAPESFRAGSTAVDHRADIYSFGVVFYRLLTATYPIWGTDVRSWIASHLFEEPKPFESVDSEGRVPESLRQIAMAALAKEPDERLASATEFAKRLRAAAREIGISSHAGEASTIIREARREPDIAKRPSPGTTQQSLNETFPPVPEGKPSDVEVDQNASAEELVTQAREHLEAKEWAATRKKLIRAIELDPFRSEARQLLMDLEVARREAERLNLADRAIAEIKKLIEDEQFSQAIVSLESNAQRFPEFEDFNTLREQLDRDMEGVRKREETRERRQAADEALESAHQLMSEKAFSQARVEAARALELFPDDESARALVAAISSAEQRHELDLAVAAARERITRMIDRGELEQAETELGTAYHNFGTDVAQLDDVANLLNEAVANRLAKRLDGWLESGRERLEGLDYDGARAMVKEILEEEPDNEAARQLERDIGDAIAAQRRQQRQQAELNAQLAYAESLIRADDYSKARAQLEKARNQFGTTPEIEHLDSRRRRQLESDFQNLLGQIPDSSDAAAIGKARDLIKLAEKLIKGEEDLEKRLAERRGDLEQRAAAAKEAEQYRAAVAKIVATAKQQLAKDELDAVEATLETAPAQPKGAAPDPQLSRLRREIEAKRSQLRERRHADSIDQARKALAGGDPDQALEHIERARGELASSAQADEIETAARAAIERTRQEQIVDDAASRVDRLAQAGDFEQANRIVDETREAIGESETFDTLLTRVEALRAQVNKRDALEHLDRGRQLIVAGKPEEAIPELRRAIELDSSMMEPAALLDQAENAIRQRQEELELRARAQETADSIGEAIEEHDLDRARAEIDRQRELLGDAGMLTELEERLEEANRKKADAVAQLSGLIQESIDQGRLDEARELIASGRERHGDGLFSAEEEQMEAASESAEVQRLDAQLANSKRAIARGELTDAAVLLRELKKVRGADPEIDDLLANTERQLDKEKQDRERVSAISETRNQAEQLMARSEYQAALDLVSGTIKQFSASEELLPVARRLRGLLREREEKRKRLIKVGLGIAAGVLVLALLVIWWLGREPASPGPRDVGDAVLFVDARPWANILMLRSEEQPNVELLEQTPSPTPLFVRLAPGTYRITAEGPDGRRTQELEVEVGRSGTTTQEFVFERPSAQELLESLGQGGGGSQ